MQRTIWWLAIILLCSATSQCLASEISIWDKQVRTATHHNEDQKVEPGAAYQPGWDLEGMFYKNGIYSGHIFISTGQKAVYDRDITPANTQGNGTILNTFGYTFVFDADWESYANNFGSNTFGTENDTYRYTLRKIDTKSRLNPSTGPSTGNPVSYAPGGTEVIRETELSYGIVDDTRFQGMTHYTITGFNLKDIPGFNASFIAHFTQEWSIDGIIGQAPEPATMLLLGIGLLGIGAIGRKLPVKTV